MICSVAVRDSDRDLTLRVIGMSMSGLCRGCGCTCWILEATHATGTTDYLEFAGVSCVGWTNGPIECRCHVPKT